MKRTIAAILAADVAGYSRLTAEDEDDTLTRLGEYSRVFRAEVAEVGGRIFNTAGDAILAEFPSAVEALRAAIAIQEKLRLRNAEYPQSRKVQFRMGLNIGDVFETEWGDLLGDGVNVAARLEGIADPGGICISRSVHEAIAAKLSVAFRDIGPQRLKNIPRPVHAFRVMLPSDALGDTPSQKGRRGFLVKTLAAGIAALLLLGGGLWWALSGGTGEPVPEDSALASAPEKSDRPDLLSASVANPKRMCFADEVWASGVLVPRREVEVGPEIEGLRIQKLYVSTLDEVTSGQLLAQLSRPDRPDVAVASIRAPVTGTIGRVNAIPGALTSFKAPPLFQIIVQGELELTGEVPIRALGKLAQGQSVVVTPLGNANVVGRVRAVSSVVDGGTQLGRVRILLRTNARLRQGTFARGVVKVGERCGLSVPLSAIDNGEQGSVVYVSNGGRVEGRLVETGLSSATGVEIRSGLDERDLVVTRAGSFVREGDVIKPIAAAGKTAAN